jgi:hypothetical protein
LPTAASPRPSTAIPTCPVGGNAWHDMAGKHVILDIGGGHYVLYGHLK